ncbi:MAG: sigma-70 family RNA polymerase sigma factor [Phycisphaerales bacterium]|nr:MAG: sigma-70 family RNA polymerase sigma factor [Phycisphaerales bacterium]
MSKPMESHDLEARYEVAESAEVALVRRARDGDSEAFSDLVDIYQRRTVSVAYRLLGNIEDASDVSQEAFIRAYRHLGQLEDLSRFGSWLLRVVSNLALDFRRGRKRREAVSLDDSLTLPEEARQPGTGLRLTGADGEEAESLPDELQTAIDDAMGQLPEKQRLALVLFSIEGIPQKQVAEILECSVELVKWNVFQARKKLKEMLTEYL